MNKPSTLSKETSLILVAAAFVFLHPYTACAQSVSFAGAQTTLNVSVGGIGLSYPWGVAVDRAGDVFIADAYNNRVVKVPAGGGAQTTVPASGLSGPFGVAVDGAGDVFIADSNNNRVVEVPWTGTGYGAQTTVGSGLNSPYGVAVDGAGDVFTADSGNNRVVEVPAGGGAQKTVGSGLSHPSGVAVDGAGDVFIADSGNSRVVEGSAGGGAQTTVAASRQNWPLGVAVDGAGDVFIADTNNNRVVEVPGGGGAQTTVGSGLLTPYGVAVDGAGDVFIADAYNSRVVEVQRVAVNFGSVNICPGGQTTPAPCSQTLTLNYSVNVTTTFGSNPTVLTQGGPNLDFTLGSTTCTGMITAPGSCTVNVSFAPLAPGLRMGAVQLKDSSANLLVTTFVHGLSLGPAIAFGPGAQTTVGSGLNQPSGVAVDGAGDVFIADSGHSQVVEVPAGGVQTTVGSGLSSPLSVAVDGAGDVFIADTYNNRVVEVPAGGGAQTTVGSGLNRPVGAAVDGAGDVFIADTGNNRVVEVPWTGTSYGAQTTVRSGLNTPWDVAVDGAGDVFIADEGNSRVVEVQRSEAPTLSFAATEVGSTSTDSPQSVTVQNIGNQSLAAVSPGLSIGATSFAQVAGSGTPADCTSSFSLEPGASCNLSVSFIPQTTGSIVSAATFTDNALNATAATQSVSLSGTGINPAATFSPTSVAFGNKEINTASVAKNVFLTSSGTTNLSKPSITITGTNAPDFSQTNTCTAASYAPGAKCTISVKFTPSMLAAESASLMLTDNASNSPQTVPLTGAGVMPVVLSPTSLAFGNLAEGETSASKIITLTNYQQVALTDISVSTGSADYPQTNTCGTSVAAGKMCKIAINFKPSIVGADDATLSISDSASNSPQTAALTGTGLAPVKLTPASETYASQTVGTTSAAKVFTLTSYLTATVNSIVISTTGDFAVSSTTCTTTLTTKAKCTIDVTFKPTATGTRPGTLSVSDSAPNSPQTSTLTGTGK